MRILDREPPTSINVARMRPVEVTAVVVDPRGLSIDLAEEIAMLADIFEDGAYVPYDVTVEKMMELWDSPLLPQDRIRLTSIGVDLARIDGLRKVDLGHPNTIFTFTP